MTDLEGRLDWFKLLTTDTKAAEAFWGDRLAHGRFRSALNDLYLRLHRRAPRQWHHDAS